MNGAPGSQSGTYYDILGVPRDVPQPYIQQAYAQRRAQFEAARQGGTDPRTVDAWVAELETAYRVVGDPRTRMAYDAYLRGQGPPPPVPAGPPQLSAATKRSGRARSLIGALVTIMALFAVGIWASQRDKEEAVGPRDEQGAIDEAATVNVTALRSGDCFSASELTVEASTEPASVDMVRVVPCDETHTNEVFHEAPIFGLDAYPTQDELAGHAGDNCLPAFAEFVGTAYEESELELGYLYPDEASFGQGIFTLTCFVYDPSGDVTETLESSNR